MSNSNKNSQDTFNLSSMNVSLNESQTLSSTATMSKSKDTSKSTKNMNQSKKTNKKDPHQSTSAPLSPKAAKKNLQKKNTPSKKNESRKNNVNTNASKSQSQKRKEKNSSKTTSITSSSSSVSHQQSIDHNASSTSTLSLNLTTEKSHYPFNEKISTFLNLQVKGALHKEAEKRAPLDIMIVLDKSGSMYGEKINLCKATIEFLVSQLSDQDSLGLTLFDSNVQSYDIMRMNQEGKSKVESILDNTYDGSCTNLSGGLFKGMEVLSRYNNQEGTGKRLKTLFLLTDGQANEGVTNSSTLISTLIDEYLSKDRNIIINTFGYGNDHDLHLLQRISEVGHGSYYFVKDNASVADCFADCLGGLLSIVAEDLEINFTTSTEMIITPMEGQNAIEVNQINTGKSYTIRIKDIRSEESKDIMFELTLPNLNASNSMMDWNPGKFSYQYQDLKNEAATVYGEQDLIIPRMTREDLTSINVKKSEEVVYNYLRVLTVDVLTKARSVAKSNVDNARALLTPIREKVNQALAESTMSSFRGKLQSLLRDINQSIKAMRSRDDYLSEGRFFIQSTINENDNQRSCKLESAYASPMQMQMRSAARSAVSSSKYMTSVRPSSFQSRRDNDTGLYRPPFMTPAKQKSITNWDRLKSSQKTKKKGSLSFLSKDDDSSN